MKDIQSFGLPGLRLASTEELERITALAEGEYFFLFDSSADIVPGPDAESRFVRIAADSAVKLCYDFYLQHPDETLIVVTADHEFCVKVFTQFYQE